MPDPIPHALTLVLEKKDAGVMRKALDMISGLRAVKVLSDGKAIDAVIDTDNPKALQTDILGLLGENAIRADICVQSLQNRRKSLLICDMDSTLIGQECIDELADFAGVKDRVSAITERAMRGDIGFDGEHFSGVVSHVKSQIGGELFSHGFVVCCCRG